jgi:hypothetical protein
MEKEKGSDYMSLYMDLIKTSKERRGSGDTYNGISNTILYGVGKSSLVASLSEYLDKDVLAITPAGTSEMLEDSYPKFHCYNVNNLQEIKEVLDDILVVTNRVAKIRRALFLKDERTISEAKVKLKTEYETYRRMAEEGDYGIGALVIEECSTISHWIENAVADSMNVAFLGEDKKKMSADWSLYKREAWDFFSKILRIPVPIFLSCNVIEAKEKQDINKRMPNVCIGSALGMILENVANVFYIYKEGENYKVQLQDTNETYCKNKLTPPESLVTIEKHIDITKNPKRLFEYLDEIKTKVRDEKIKNNS